MVMRQILLTLVTLLCSAAEALPVRIVVENNTDRVRQQVVEVSTAEVRQQLGLADGETFVVRNAFGQLTDYQLTYDGQLLLDVSVRPQGVAAFTVERGTPRQPKAYVCGRQYKERKDDMAWENDRCAYRMYGPALQRTGERSFGIDVWTKSTPDLVLDRRYALDCAGNAVEDSLRKLGQRDQAQAIDLETSFHLDHGDGMDAYAVGATLGCGAPALMKDGELLMPWCYQSYRILDNGPLRFTVELDYGNEHRRVTLDKGSNFNRMTVWHDSLPATASSACELAAGVVLHGGEPVMGGDYVLYADPTDNAPQHNSQIFVGVLFPEGVAQTRVVTSRDKSRTRHGVGIVADYDGRPYTYWFGAAWSRSDVRSMDEWLLRTRQQLADLREPLTASVQEPLIGLIDQVNTYWQSHHAPQVRSFWDHAAYHTGNMEAYRLTGFERYRRYSEQWAEHNHWQGATEVDPAKWKYKQYGEGQDYVLFGDWQICFQTYIDLFSLDHADVKVQRALEVMGYEADSRATDYWWWADALYMVMPVMTKMYRLTGDQKYLDKLYQNICYSDSIMLDRETGLYYRDGRYVYPAHQTQAGRKDFWARGDGWVLAGLAKVLQDLPRNYRHRRFFERKYVRLAQAVARLQQPEGYWTRSMMDPEQAPGPETSGTAFFCYGLLWGVNNGLLPRKDYAPVIDRAWHYLTTTALQPDGSVGYVQPIGDRAVPGQVVNARSQANFGVGAFLLAACEYYRYR